MLKVLAAIQFRSRGEWRNLPFFAISRAFRHREVQKDCQNRKREIGYMPLENCPILKTAYFQSFPCGCGFNQTKKREKAVNVSLFTVGHVFVGFVERVGSGIGNAEFATLFFCYLWKIISHLQYFFVYLFLKL